MTVESTRVRRSFGPVVIGCAISLFLAFLAFFSARWFVSIYGKIGFDSILYTLNASLNGVEPELLAKYVMLALLPCILCTGITTYLLFFFPHRKNAPMPSSRQGTVRILLCIVLILILITVAAFDCELVEYVVDQFSDTPLYETYYRDPQTTRITFPAQKRNLVYIMLESMETSYFSQELGGAMEQNLIPELYGLANKNLCFSNNKTAVGGYYTTNGATWTIGSMVAQTAGIPLKTPTEDVNKYGSEGEAFLPGVTSLTNILQDAGYYQVLMVGSDASFGGREPYFLQHGADEVLDVYTARRDGIIPNDYFVWWGMEDMYLFEYAKEKITDLAIADQPFALTMLTVDTHHVGGYQCSLCQESASGETYDQSISCSSRQVVAFVKWLQKQPFYENTTIVIVGDHESMDNGYFERNVDPEYQRMLYNCFVNAAARPAYTKNRQWTAMDLFPTTLAALGCTIEGNRLGLGTNLFSNQITLCEKYGFEQFNEELSKAADYYEENFWNEKPGS